MSGPQPVGLALPIDGQLPDQAAIDQGKRSFHAYVHIPFCRVRCGYCDFNTYTANELRGEKQSDFAQRLLAEIALSENVLASSSILKRPMKSVFFGGGTPTMLPAADLVEILAALVATHGLIANAEVTTEANPDNVTVDYLRELKAGGFTRISLGMQSAVPSVLATLERTHNPENVASAVAAAKLVGLQTSVDLIYGAPGETLDQWRTSLAAAIELETDHISAYSLIVEDGTKLARQIKSGALIEADQDELADKYELADDMLQSAGFDWYEVSNWSRSEQTRSTHNLAYWQGQDWWGYGPGAHSHVGGVRWWNLKHPATYAQKLNLQQSPAAGHEVLDEQTRLVERVLLEIRIRDGLEISTVKLANSQAAEPISGFIANGLVEPTEALKGKIVLTRNGRLLADSMVRDLLA